MTGNAALYMKMVESLDSIKDIYDASSVWISQSEREGHSTKSDRPKKLRENTTKICYLHQHLYYRLIQMVKDIRQNQSGSLCILADKTKRQIRLPVPIRRCLVQNNSPWHPQNVNLIWVATYLAGIHPDTSQEGWINFTCSHRCLSCETGVEMICLVAHHMNWESIGDNLSRGYKLCRKNCKHCGIMLCKCNNLHDPTCI